MKTKLLTSVQINAVLPVIIKKWRMQEYPSILAGVANAQLDKGRSPELAFSLVENAAGNWLEIHLKENNWAFESETDRKKMKKELIKTVYERYQLIKTGRAKAYAKPVGVR